MRRRVVVLLVIVGLLGGCKATLPGTAASSAKPSAVVLTVPNVVGRNADIAYEDLTRLGFTKIDFGTVDGHKFVALPQNWVVRTQSARAGDRLASDSTIVLGCARMG